MVAKPEQTAPEETQRGSAGLEAPRLFRALSLIRRSAIPTWRRELGLSEFEWRMMSHVGASGPISLTDLANLTTQDKGQLSRCIRRLVDAGLLQRKSQRGRRGVFISQTAAGQMVFDQIMQLAVNHNARLIQGITADRLRTFAGVLQEIETNALAMITEEPDDWTDPAVGRPAPPGPD